MDCCVSEEDLAACFFTSILFSPTPTPHLPFLYLHPFTPISPSLPLPFRTDLDCNAKFWRLIADLMNDLATFLELLAPLFPSLFLLIVCCASVSKVRPPGQF